jgi:photosystem II stability/assembly factor-like uncharacterized protein
MSAQADHPQRLVVHVGNDVKEGTVIMKRSRWPVVVGLIGLVLTLSLHRLLANQGDISWVGVGAGGGGAWMGVTVNPNNPDQVLMGSDTGGIYRSTDGGLTWTNANLGPITDPVGDAGWYAVERFAYDPNQSGTVYAGALRGVLKSTDGGATWSRAFDINSLSGWRALAVVAVDPTTAGRVYVASGSILGHGNLGCIYRTDDGFATAPVGHAFTNDNPTCDPNILTGPNVNSILIDPNNPQVLLISTENGIFRSEDGGAIWALKVSGLPLNNHNTGHLALANGIVYVTLRTVVVPPLPGEKYVSPDSWQGGVYKSEDCFTNPSCVWSEANGVDDPEPLNGNGNFEQPPVPSVPPSGWGYTGTSGYVTREFVDGQYRINVTTAVSNQSAGVLSTPFTVTAGDRLVISGRARVIAQSCQGDSSTFFGRISYYNGTTPVKGSRCQHPDGVPWENLWKARETSNSDWRRYEAVVTVPDQATLATLDIYTYNCQGTTWIDDIHVLRANSLPKLHSFQDYTTSGYNSLVGDPFATDTLYVGTDYNATTDTDGIWKTDDGGQTWTHDTRHVYHDNVIDKRANKDPIDPLASTDATGCDAGYSYSPVYGIGIGSGAAGHETLYMTSSFFAYKKKPPAVPPSPWEWEEITHDHAPSDPYPGGRTLWKARGVTNNIATLDVKMMGSKVLLGDTDNLVQISHDAGATFRQEGIDRGIPLWQRDSNIKGSGASSIVIGNQTTNQVYVGVKGYDADSGGVVFGCLSCTTTGCTDPSLCPGLTVWHWETSGTGFELGGAFVRLAQLPMPSSKLFAAVNPGPGVAKGVYRNDGAWVNATGSGLPDPLITNAIIADKVSGSTYRLFIAAGSPDGFTVEEDNGIFMSLNPNDLSPTWCRITPGPLPGQPCGQNDPPVCGHAVTSLLFGPSGELYAGMARKDEQNTAYGLYRGTGSGCAWTWTRVLEQARVTSVVRSPVNANVLYAASSQQNKVVGAQNAGIWKSVDAGVTWEHLDLNGLMQLKHLTLEYSSDGGTNLAFYAVTPGGGIYKATILPPAVPTGLTGEPAGSKKVQLYWEDNSFAEQGYKIERKKNSGGSWSQVFQTGPNATEYLDTTQSGGHYFYQIRGFDEAGDSTYSNEAHVIVQN